MDEDGYNSFLYLCDALVLANSYTHAKEDGQRVVQLLQRVGFVLSLETCHLEPTQEFTHLGLVFNTQNMTLSLPQDKVLTIKAQTAKEASSPTCKGVMRLLGLTNFFWQHGTTTSKITFSSHQYWIKENYQTPVDVFKGLKPAPEASQALHWWCTFKPQPKSIFRPLIEERVTTDASMNSYGCHMNNLSFKGRGLQRRAGPPTSISWSWIQY